MADSAPKLVTLVAPDGSGEVNVSHPSSITNLVYGSGYKVKGNKSPDAAAAWLADDKDHSDFHAKPEDKGDKVDVKKV